MHAVFAGAQIAVPGPLALLSRATSARSQGCTAAAGCVAVVDKAADADKAADKAADADKAALALAVASQQCLDAVVAAVACLAPF